MRRVIHVHHQLLQRRPPPRHYQRPAQGLADGVGAQKGVAEPEPLEAGQEGGAAEGEGVGQPVVGGGGLLCIVLVGGIVVCGAVS